MVNFFKLRQIDLFLNDINRSAPVCKDIFILNLDLSQIEQKTIQMLQELNIIVQKTLSILDS